ncbi:uncharacterized protein RHIMIDRAFT_253221 [Rhizopus microsporus ATCC 52813]|uniref:Uncharacterized protein n=1 Tax=Rhizopus microsporus ATCC 52813 TaxID=1340429 RepID=A0A2G4T837_RHIZD|nr:uncharacterized protein RHIMIDRAFT_253221 [Rhizopus microsporus ATCC 52813]PHZ17161.1 hypothetical protein RHIMIDRAFT_253221 [Rhizopus microsporus ATCC 52813]
MSIIAIEPYDIFYRVLFLTIEIWDIIITLIKANQKDNSYTTLHLKTLKKEVY